jgi:hypothetical protein
MSSFFGLMMDDLDLHMASVSLDPEMDAAIASALNFLFDPLRDVDEAHHFFAALFPDSVPLQHHSMTLAFNDLGLNPQG